MKYRTMIAVVAMAMLASGCSDDAGPPGTDSAIVGHVSDAHGQPVAGASIVLQLDTDGLPFGAADKPSHVIRFELPEGGQATVWVGSYCDADTVRMLIRGEELPAGQFSVAWNGLDDRGRVAPDGVYWFHVVLPDSASRAAFALLRQGYADLSVDAAVIPGAISDFHGAFALDQACLPFGHEFTYTDENGQTLGTYTVSRHVRVWVLHPDYAAEASDWVPVDPETGARVDVTLGP